MPVRIYTYKLLGRSLQVIEKAGSYEAHPESTGLVGSYSSFEEAARAVDRHYPDFEIPTEMSTWALIELEGEE